MQRILDVLDVFEGLAAASHDVTLDQLSAATGRPLATVQGLVKVLEARGYVRRNAARRYALGTSLIGLGDAASRVIAMRAHPYLTEMAEVSGETSNLALLGNDHVVYVAQVPSRRKRRMFTEVGARFMPHCTAVGKVLLAALPEAEAVILLRRTGLPRRTPYTVTRLDRLLQQFEAIREDGYAVDRGEEAVGVCCFAVPVAGVGGSVAAMSVSGPHTRLTLEACERLVPEMKRIAAAFATQVTVPVEGRSG